MADEAKAGQAAAEVKKEQEKQDAEQARKDAATKANQAAADAAEKLAKQKKEAEKKAAEREDREKREAEGIRLSHTGKHDLEMSNKRANARLNQAFHGYQKEIYNTVTRGIQRIERSPGGSAARKAARRIREKGKALTAQFSHQVTALEEKSSYAKALKGLVEKAWWHQRFNLRMLSMKAAPKKEKIALAAALRAKDTHFQAAYADLKAKRQGEREQFLAERARLVERYSAEKAALGVKEARAEEEAAQAAQLQATTPPRDITGTFSYT